jgi:large subunit ribosomal protein L35
MPKQKTHKGLKKRVKITASGKVKYKGPYGGHLMTSKSAKRRRRIGKPAIMIPVMAEKIKLMLNQ